MDETELRRWAIDTAIRAEERDFISAAQRIVDFVCAQKPPDQPRSKKDGFIKGARLNEMQKALIREKYASCDSVAKLARVVSDIGPAVGPGNVRSFASYIGLKRPAFDAPHLVKARTVLAARRNGAAANV